MGRRSEALSAGRSLYFGKFEPATRGTPKMSKLSSWHGDRHPPSKPSHQPLQPGWCCRAEGKKIYHHSHASVSCPSHVLRRFGLIYTPVSRLLQYILQSMGVTIRFGLCGVWRNFRDPHRQPTHRRHLEEQCPCLHLHETRRRPLGFVGRVPLNGRPTRSVTLWCCKEIGPGYVSVISLERFNLLCSRAGPSSVIWWNVKLFACLRMVLMTLRIQTPSGSSHHPSYINPMRSNHRSTRVQTVWRICGFLRETNRMRILCSNEIRFLCCCSVCAYCTVCTELYRFRRDLDAGQYIPWYLIAWAIVLGLDRVSFSSS